MGKAFYWWIRRTVTRNITRKSSRLGKANITFAAFILSQNKSSIYLCKCRMNPSAPLVSSVRVLPTLEEKTIEVSFTGKTLLWKQKLNSGFSISCCPRRRAPWWLKANGNFRPILPDVSKQKFFSFIRERSCVPGKWMNSSLDECWFSFSLLVSVLPGLLFSNCLLLYFPLSFCLSLYSQVFFASLLPPLPSTSILSLRMQGDVWSPSALGSMGRQLL